MRVQTTNRLAHLQVELQETIEQNYCLQAQVQPKQEQIAYLEQYLRVNSGDRKLMTKYRKACRELTTLCNRINRNNQKITRLQYNIGQEELRIQMGYAKPRRNVRRMY